MWGSTDFLFCSSASGFLRRSCFWCKVGDGVVRGVASGLLHTCLVLVTNQREEQAQPRMAPALHNMISLHGGQVGFSVEADGVWWAVGVEGLNPVLKRADSAGRKNPGKWGETPELE